LVHSSAGAGKPAEVTATTHPEKWEPMCHGGGDESPSSLSYVRSIRSRHGNGKLYYQYRRGTYQCMLPGPLGSEAFLAAYAAAEARLPAPAKEIGASRTQPGTFNELIVAYYKSAEWKCA